MRFRSVLLPIITVVLLSAADASAQKRLFSVVDPNADAFSDTIDVYDPQTGRITAVGDRLTVGRERPAVLPLDSGRRALIAGGINNRYLNNAEVYNPEDGSITETGSLLSPRGNMLPIIAPGGLPLIIGGYNSNYLYTVEQYDPISEKFIMVSGSMIIPRQFATSTLFDSSYILITGGYNGSILADAEVYDSVNRTFFSTAEVMNQARIGHAAAVISTESILIAGGCNNSISDEMVCDSYLASAEILDTSDGTFTLTGNMTVARKDHTATDLGGGRILVVGGMNASGVLASAEIYDPATGAFTPTGNMAAPRVNHTATLLPDGRVVIAGGESAGGAILSSVEIYNPASGTFTTLAEQMTDARTMHSAIVLNDGKVLFVAGIKKHKLVFDTNFQVLGDNIGGNIYFTPDSQVGFVAYTGSGTVLAFEPQKEKGGTLRRIETGGNPVHITPILDGRFLAVVSALDNRIFIIDTATFQLSATYSFNNAGFGYGSRIALSPDGGTGYISSASTGHVIKFDVASGNETGRISGFRVPAQITVTRNGDTLLVVDTSANTIKGVNAGSMTLKYTFAPQDVYYAAVFSIHNKVTLNEGETLALITSQDAVIDGYSAAFLFDPVTGEWIVYEDEDEEERNAIYAIGSQPGWTMLLPDKESWLTLTQNSVSLIPTVDPRTVIWDDGTDDDTDSITAKNYGIPGSPMGSSNVVLTPDGRYAFIASATTDQVFHMDLQTGAVIGAYALGDDPNLSPDQPITVALTPDAGILAAMSFATNEINLLVDSYVYRQTRYISQQDRFTGISIINVSPDEDALVQITARTNSGAVHDYYNDDDPMTNPVTLVLEPNAQKSIDISELLILDNDVQNNGYLTIDSNKPIIVGYAAVGQIQSSFLTAHIRSMEGTPFFSVDDVPLDMILPEIPEDSDATAEISLVNPWYSTLTYSVTHYGPDGTEMAVQETTLNSLTREETEAAGVTTTVAKSQVLIVGGYSGSQTISTAETFNGNALSYTSSGSTQVARYGHTTVLLPSGNVLIAGGRNESTIHKTAELYNPSSYYRFTFTPGSMNVERYRHTATRLLNGKVLLAGGQNMDSITRTAELFDFATGSFSYTKDEDGNRSDMNIPRDAHTATRLNDGRVLIAGGLDGMGVSNTAEIYDYRTGKFTLLPGTMNDRRVFHTATLLGDGRVLIVGGYNGEYLKSAEIFNPLTNMFEPVSDMADARGNHAATLLSDGTVLITGGRNLDTEVNEAGGLDTAEVFDPTYGNFLETGNNMTIARSYHTAVNFMDDQDGINDRVIISGGFGEIGSDDEPELGALSTSDIYTPGTRMFTRASGSMSTARQGHTAILLDEAVSAGYLRITSDMGVLASESYNFEYGGAPTSVNAIDMAKYKGVSEIYSPRFVLEGGRTTRLNVINGSEEVADITLELYSDAGVLMASRTYQAASNSQTNGTLADVFDNPVLSNMRGWIKASSTQDQIVGTVTFLSLTGADKYMGSFELTAALPSASSPYCYIFPLVAENGDYETELSFLNSGAATASLTLQLWNVNGSVSDAVAVSRTLAPGTNMYGTLSGIFRRTLDTGNVRVISNQPIHGFGEIKSKSGRFMTPVPATRYSCP